jgi:hypothetical protein
MTISRQLTLEFGEEKLMSSPVGFPVSPSVPLEKGWEKKMSAIFGLKCSGQSEKSDHGMSWGKMFVDSLIGRTDWSSKRCSLIWKVRDTKSKRLYFQLSGLTPHTAETESILLPTPTAMQDEADPAKVDARNAKQIAMGNPPFILGLSQMAMRGMLPTPNARDWKDTLGNGKDSPSIGITRGYSLGQKLNSMLPTPQASDYIDKNTSKSWEAQGGVNFSLGNPKIREMLPTPNAQDWNTATRAETYIARSQRHKQNNVTLQMTLRQMTMFMPNKVDHPKLGAGSQLNPHFVAEMMGFPINWTDLPFLSGEKNP